MGSWSVQGSAHQWNRGGSIYENPSAAMDGNYIYAFGGSTYSSNTQVFRGRPAVRRHADPPTGMWTSGPVVSGTGMLQILASTVSGVQKYGVAAFDAATQPVVDGYPARTWPARRSASIVAVTSGQQRFSSTNPRARDPDLAGARPA